MPPGALIAGWAAAYVHGVDAFDGLDHLTFKLLPVPVLLPPGLHRKSTPAIHYRQCTRRIRGDVIEGIPVTMLLRTAYDLAREATDLTEAVVALDAILATRQLKLEHLRDKLNRLDGQRGAHQDIEAGLALEYDGATWRSQRANGHRDREQHREDNAREERLERAGLIVVRAEKSDLTVHRRQLIERIANARADGLARDRGRDRWTIEEPGDWGGYSYLH